MPRGRKLNRTPFLVLALTLGACDVEQLPLACPSVAPGEIVVTEIRGPQSGPNTRGEWIELYAPGMELRGLELTFTELDGSGGSTVRVRRDLVANAEGYVTLGSGDTEQAPVDIDYGAGNDFGGLPSSGILEVRACNEVVDAVIFRGLPDMGTLALDGALGPDATANDDESNWCVDAREATDGTETTEFGLPGSPRVRNPSCM